MGAETKKIVTLSYVTDTDVGYYNIGDVEGSFDENELKDFIKKFGHQELSSHLGYLQMQIWNTAREINRIDDNILNNTKTPDVSERGDSLGDSL
jgi:hypothetical protein